MMLFKSHKNNEKKSIEDKLKRWIKSHNKKTMINVISEPYSDVGIFTELILEELSERKKVLYITNEDENDIRMLKEIRKSSSFRDYAYFRNKGAVDKGVSLVFSNHENAWDIDMDFDFVIYDDISSYAGYMRIEIEELIISKKPDRAIAYTIDEVFLKGDTIEHSAMEIPFIEPRIINTRIDINKDIPYMIYDYLSYFIKSKRNVVIYMPDDERMENIKGCLLDIDEEYKSMVIDFDADKKKAIKKMKNSENATINFVKSLYNIPENVKNLDVIVYFADDAVFTYKKLIFICGRAGVINGSSLGEVIFLANSTSVSMTKAKDMARSFNKSAWESGYLKV